MASKNKNLAELLDANGDVLLTNLDNVSVTPTAISDQPNTSTGALDIPTGTTAQRPSSPTSGMIRYNTDTEATEVYDGVAWGKVSPLTPTLTSITGTVYTTIASNLTLVGTNFLTANLVVGFTPSGGSETTVTVTPTSNTAATVAVPSAIYNQSGGTSISVTVTNSDNRTSGAQSFSVTGLPTGGDHVFDQGSARVHIFKSNGNFVVPSGVSLSNVEYLIVAGGGGGGSNGGGGGAGGLRSSVVGDTSGRGASAETRMSLSAATYPVVVGTGGSGANGSGGSQTNGVASSFNSISSTGGGAGGEIYGSGGAAGGSGGGGAGFSGTSAGDGTSGQGYDGGVGYTIDAGGYAGAGGGGAGVVGGNASAGASGIGGDGQISTIITTSEATTYSVGDVVSSDVYFAGGGHGRGAGTIPSTAARGSYGGGGQSITAQEGVDYTGGGGGGNNSATNNGGDGVVIIRYTL